jgi:hypothetical protein
VEKKPKKNNANYGDKLILKNQPKEKKKSQLCNKLKQSLLQDWKQ